MKAAPNPLRTTDNSMLLTPVEKVVRLTSRQLLDSLAIEEPLEIQLNYGPSKSRQTRSISVTMRTPGNDFDLAAGFLMTEGVIRDANDVEQITYAGYGSSEGELSPQTMDAPKVSPKENIVRVDLATDVVVSLGTLQRNFYTTSSCGICGKASLLALRTVCPPRTPDSFAIDSSLLCGLPVKTRLSQNLFQMTGGLHASALFDSLGILHS